MLAGLAGKRAGCPPGAPAGAGGLARVFSWLVRPAAACLAPALAGCLVCSTREQNGFTRKIAANAQTRANLSVQHAQQSCGTLPRRKNQSCGCQNAITLREHMHRLIAAILLPTALSWGPQDKATKLPRLWLPTATPVIAGETAWPLDAAQRRKLGKVLRLRRGDELRVFDGGMGEWLASFEDDCVVAKNGRGQPRRLHPWSSSSRRSRRSALRY